MEDGFNELVHIHIINDLGEQADYSLADIKKALEEKEKLEKAFELACKKLEDKDSTLYDLYDSLDYYYESKDKHEWKKYLLERVEEDEED